MNHISVVHSFWFGPYGSGKPQVMEWYYHFKPDLDIVSYVGVDMFSSMTLESHV